MHPKVLLRSEKINKIEPTPPLPYQFDTIIYFDKKDPKYCPTLALRPEGTWTLRTHSILETQITYALQELGHARHSRHFFINRLKAISSYYTTLLSNFVDPLWKCLPPFTFVLQRQMKGMEASNRCCCSTP